MTWSGESLGVATERLRLAVATALGVGLVPVAPGTAGSLPGVALYAGLALVGGPWPAAAGTLGVIALGLWSAGAGERRWGKDPGAVVIDEVAGQMLALTFVPVTTWNLICGFALFRLFDITKPPPARRFERLSGGTGIMLDDLVAGVYANVVLRIAIWLVER